MTHHYPDLRMYIDGETCVSSDGATRPVLNPATEQEIGRVPTATAADLDRALAAAARGFRTWRSTPVSERTRILRKAADLITADADHFAHVMTLEAGKTYRETRGEALRVADTLRWNIEEARRAYGRVVPVDDQTLLTVRREPVGPVAAFTPWNFPIGSPMRKIAAALAAGCSIVVKAASETPGTANEIARRFHDAGLPPGVLNVVFGDGAMVAKHLIESPVTRLVAFTGSVPVGKQVAALAGSVMKPSIMELGGHAPVIVCADADPVTAAKRAAKAKFHNAGQVCTSPSRFLVHESLIEAFTDAFVKECEAVGLGDGFSGADMGPLSNVRRLTAMQDLVADAVDRGATIRTGGTRPDRPGYFFPPTVLTDVPLDARCMVEEPFGPLAPIVPFTEFDEAVRIANSLPFGLAAYLFTKNAAVAERFTREIEAGVLSVNHCGGSVSEAPSGGFKESGYGREGGSEVLDAYLATKRVHHLLEA
ncbi:NAD-dependent succinate-semialdehyde dehydrogenase [Glycomyces endophyticus]|uniref:NAD-dependent succinate-semialdehyde dehydrogenase n=1 Tax=Glycomyces endophyticus TaxID=480996 RepID=A0ABN2HK53_9ACTN